MHAPQRAAPHPRVLQEPVLTTCSPRALGRCCSSERCLCGREMRLLPRTWSPCIKHSCHGLRGVFVNDTDRTGGARLLVLLQKPRPRGCRIIARATSYYGVRCSNTRWGRGRTTSEAGQALLRAQCALEAHHYDYVTYSRPYMATDQVRAGGKFATSSPAQTVSRKRAQYLTKAMSMCINIRAILISIQTMETLPSHRCEP